MFKIGDYLLDPKDKSIRIITNIDNECYEYILFNSKTGRNYNLPIISAAWKRDKLVNPKIVKILYAKI